MSLREITKLQVTLGAVVMFLWNLCFVIADAKWYRSRMPGSPLLLLGGNVLLISLAIAAQLWIGDRPRYRGLKLAAYGLTLVWCGSLGLLSLAFLLGR